MNPASIQLHVRRHKMVGWYDPGQLVNTGLQVLISQIFGTRADYRLIESFSGAEPIHDFSTSEECWFDYVADLGDGWNSTYAIANLLASERLTVHGSGGQSVETPRGAFLIMGGDQVYPVASRDQYEQRTVAPYASAFPDSDDQAHPALFAIPGNHDCASYNQTLGTVGQTIRSSPEDLESPAFRGDPSPTGKRVPQR